MRFFVVSILSFSLFMAPVSAQDGATEAPEVVEAVAPDENASTEEAPTDTIPESFDEAVEDVSALVNAVESKNWPVAAGVFFMLLTFLANKFGLKDKVGAAKLPWAVMGLSIIGTLGIALAGGVAVPTALVQGLTAGLAAIGSWEAFFKLVLKKKTAGE